MGSFWAAILGAFDPNTKIIKRMRRRVEDVNALEPQMQALADEDFPLKTQELRDRIQNGESLDDILPESFALTREAARRVLGERPFDVQLIGGMVLHEGKIAEMKTGEGKTLTATLPLVLNALSGKGAHLVTTNDFLVRWQAQWMGQVYGFLGLTVGYIQHDMSPEQRIEMYSRDITYVENSELGFDYLRDNMAGHPSQLCLPELNYAIVDEVDSILIDEARTPLIISGRPQQTVQFYEAVDRVVRRLRPSTNQDNKDETPDGDYIVDEKFHQAALTEKGQEKVEQMLGISNLSDPEYLDIAHHVNASLKAHTLYKRDVHYVVRDGEVVIVDEFTGHLQPGRRYSDGLHQAIEAKEHVRVEEARQTVATITYQNFFRLYNKLAGMTGTAKTEEAEFVRIYNMPVVVVPTNRPVARKDSPDIVFKTAEAKQRAIVSDILQAYIREQPTLVGTRSVEFSEYVSSRLAADPLQMHVLVDLCIHRIYEGADVKLAKDTRQKYLETLRVPVERQDRYALRPIAKELGVDMKPDAESNVTEYLRILRVVDDSTPADLREKYAERLKLALVEGVPHSVLNAKYHEKEGEIIAQAGRPGAVTVATNMAGRGVDIVLGGKPQDGRKFDPELQEKVRQLGGLHIIGTERHESRRIDNQLRGRSGRQGDPGSSRFYVSLEDELMRLFGPERFGFFLNSWPEEEAIEHKIVTRSIERAQEKVEMRNFDIRKHTLKYDDVMNKQREVIYGDRRRVLMGEDISESVLNMVRRTVNGVVDTYASMQIHPEDRDIDTLYAALIEAVPGLEERLSVDDVWDMNGPHLAEDLAEAAVGFYKEREQLIGPEIMRQIERGWLLRIIDTRWMQHLQEMDYLRDSVGLRAYGQMDPLLQYQKEAFEYFDALLDHVARDMTRAVLTTEVVVEQRAMEVKDMEESTPMTEAAEDHRGGSRTIVKDKEPGRNDPCPCGSGMKYKKCCMNKVKA
ncbi:MAG: preprotein translocase subunit SecA [Acidobacteriota bacterium]|nr:preprotein translocase subunit SecA [Acidobacteriota bacterium]